MTIAGTDKTGAAVRWVCVEPSKQPPERGNHRSAFNHVPSAGEQISKEYGYRTSAGLRRAESFAVALQAKRADRRSELVFSGLFRMLETL